MRNADAKITSEINEITLLQYSKQTKSAQVHRLYANKAHLRNLRALRIVHHKLELLNTYSQNNNKVIIMIMIIIINGRLTDAGAPQKQALELFACTNREIRCID